MLGMADNFRDEISKAGMAMRFNMLSEFALEDVEAAVKKILRYRKFAKMPPVADFIEALEGDKKTEALNAWGDVITALKQGKEVEHPKTREAVRRIGGWTCLTRRSYDELQWDEKRFVEHYEACDERNFPLLALEDGKVTKLLDKIGGL